ncbi:MAG: response regulator [Arachnia sp.]
MTARSHLLVVEDDPDALVYLKTILRAETDLDVCFCSTPEEALELLPGRRIDLLLTDYWMPGINGLDLSSLVRQMHPGLPVLLTTANASIDTAVKAVKGGVSDFLPKPLTRQTVVEAVRRAIALSQRPRHSVLAIGAHPDDVEIGAGATLAQHVSAGDEVTILTVSGGAVGGDPEERRRESAAAAACLGAQLVIGDLEDTAIPDGIATIRLIESVVAAERPDIVYVHSPHDVHQDHRSVYAAAMVATRNVAKVLCYQSPSATTDFHPATFVPVTTGLATKLEAVAQFTSQTAKRDYLDPDLLRATARYWGRHVHHTYAEPFEVVRDFVGVASRDAADAGRSDG